MNAVIRKSFFYTSLHQLKEERSHLVPVLVLEKSESAL